MNPLLNCIYFHSLLLNAVRECFQGEQQILLSNLLFVLLVVNTEWHLSCHKCGFVLGVDIGFHPEVGAGRGTWWRGFQRASNTSFYSLKIRGSRTKAGPLPLLTQHLVLYEIGVMEKEIFTKQGVLFNKKNPINYPFLN